MGKITFSKEQLTKLNNKEQKQKEREQAVVSLKKKTAKKNRKKAVRLKFLNDLNGLKNLINTLDVALS